MTTTYIYLTCILGYLGVLMGIAIYQAFRVKNKEDFAVAGRSLSPWVMVLTMLACWIGTGSVVGNAGKTYETGLNAWVLPLGGFLGMICLAVVARKTRSIRASSVPEIIGQRFGYIARGLAVFALVTAYLVIVSYQFNAGGAVIKVITEDAISEQNATLLAAVCIICFASIAGLMSLAYQDVITGLVITLTLMVACGIYWFTAGGWSGMEERFAAMESHEDFMQPWGKYSTIDMINFLMPSFLLVLGDANQYQRIFASRDVKGAGTAVSTLIFVSLCVELMIIIAAWIASSLVEGDEEGKYVLIYAARDFLPLPLSCLFMITIVGIIVSTANSFLLVPSTSFVTDVYFRFFPEKPGSSERASKELFVNRVGVVVFGVIAYGVSLLFAESETVFEKALYAFTIYGASITPTLLAAILWKRATKAGAISSIASGAVISLAWSEFIDEPWVVNLVPENIRFLTELDAVLPATLVSVTCLIVVSLITPNNSNQSEFWEDESPTTEASAG